VIPLILHLVGDYITQAGWMSVWLLIAADSTLHLAITYAALAAF
jgi:hypothetical protein